MGLFLWLFFMAVAPSAFFILGYFMPLNSKQIIKRDEGFRSEIYLDGENNRTVGFGFNLENGISEAAADFLFDEKMVSVRADCLKFFWYRGIHPVRQAAIENLIYNMGYPTFCKFEKMIAACQAGNWHLAANELMLDSSGKHASPYAKQVGARADRVALMLVTARWPE